jgi:hypothetical protein
MKKERYNIFSNSHKGLRRLVYEAGEKIQKSNFNAIDDVHDSVTVLLQAIRYFIYHVKKEDKVIYKAVASVAPYIVILMEEANAKGIDLTSAIEKKIYEFNSDQSQQNIIEFGIELHSSIFSFTTIVLQHIKREETVLNVLLWENYDDSQLLDMEDSISCQFLPEEKEWYTGQIVKYLNDQEIACWINLVKSCGNHDGANKLENSTKAVLYKNRRELIHQNFDLVRA